VPTPTEKRILQERRARKSGDILVPILEKLLEVECIPEDEDDFAFLDMLMRVRSMPRSKGVFSPSMLGSCVRQAYFSKRGEEKHLSVSPQANGYFLHGNFVHFKWQFAMWKAMRAGMLELVMVPADDLDIRHGMFFNGERPGVEVRIINGDFGGTIDVLVRIMGKVYVVDFKGINLIDFQRTVKRGAPVSYRRQIVGYGQNVNDAGFLSEKIEACLLVSECKAGPVGGRGSPLALHETLVPIDEHLGDVQRRLRTLRWFDHRNEVPKPECVSTTQMKYQECPFSRFCREEVSAIQREREGRARERKRDWKVARNSG
jgi:hypothetical protein